jgi:hypothetical protein
MVRFASAERLLEHLQALPESMQRLMAFAAQMEEPVLDLLQLASRLRGVAKIDPKGSTLEREEVQRDVAAAIEEIVVTLQGHDLWTQKLMHFEGILSKLGSMRGDPQIDGVSACRYTSLALTLLNAACEERVERCGRLTASVQLLKNVFHRDSDLVALCIRMEQCIDQVQRVDEVILPVGRRLEKIYGEALRLADLGKSAGTPEDLDWLLETYTTIRERELHQGLFGKQKDERAPVHEGDVLLF